MRPPDRVVELGRLSRAELAAWEQLVVETNQSYFVGPAWCLSWYESFGRNARTEVGVWSDGDQVVAVAPMVRTGAPLLPRQFGWLPRVPEWRNLGAGEGAADHLGFGCRPELRSSVVAWASTRDASVRLMNFDRSWSSELALAEAIEGTATVTYPVSLIESSQPGSRSLWKQIARFRRRLAEHGVTFDVSVGDGIDRSLLLDLVGLHAERSEAVGRSTTFTAERVRFHEALARRSTADLFPYVIAARQGARLVGAIYGFADPRRAYYYQSGWDQSFKQWRLGWVLLAEAIEFATARGAATFDLLRGDEPYKLRFGAEPVSDVTATRFQSMGGVVLASRDRAALLRDRVSRARDRGAPAAES